MKLRLFPSLVIALTCVALSFAAGTWWQAWYTPRPAPASGSSRTDTVLAKVPDDRKAKKQRMLAYPTVVQKVSSPAALLASPYRDGLIKVLCRGTEEDLKMDFLAVFPAKKDGLPAISASLRRNMRLRMEMVPFDQAPAGSSRLFMADEVDDFQLPVFWVQSFTHDEPLLRIASDRGRMQYVNRLANSVVKTPITVPCGESSSPFYFFAGDWQLYAPHAEEILLGDAPGTVRRAVKKLDRALKARGSRLIFAPIPQSASLYPDVGLGSYEGRELKSTGPANSAAGKLLQALREDGVAVCDFTSHFTRLRTFTHEGREYPSWKPDDTHWTSWATSEAAKFIAEMIRREEFLPDSQSHPSAAGSLTIAWHPREKLGDVNALEVVKSLGIQLPMLPNVELQVESSGSEAQRLLESNDTGAPVHLVGDSFVEVWSENHAGIKAHLVKELGVPVYIKWMAGGGRHGAPHLWWKDCQDKLPKVVIWMMSERDLPLDQWFEIDSGS